jgi:hypothetical protein
LWWQIPYIWKRRADGLYVINLAKTWEKLMLAARIIVAIENPNDGVCRTRVEQAQNGWRRAAVAPGPRASNTLAPGGKSVHGFPAHTLLSALPLCEVGARARPEWSHAQLRTRAGGGWAAGSTESRRCTAASSAAQQGRATAPMMTLCDGSRVLAVQANERRCRRMRETVFQSD